MINFKNNINLIDNKKMCLIDRFYKAPIIWAEIIIIIIASILHIIFGFIRKGPDFNTYDLFNSSPFFDFSLSNNCSNKSYNIFHTWEGWKKKEYSVAKDKYVWVIHDRTNITKINGNNFCYKFISYKDLLNKGQIIKHGEECPIEYNKNCGRIDTLNQELCIKKNEKCPLYDIGIGEPPDNISYIYNKDSNIYYNNDNYNITNKAIIGRLILNDGQPCYQSTEKLWKKFANSEAAETHLNCTNIQIFNKVSDDRYIEKGEITYKKLYEENLNEKAKNITINNVTDNEIVHLYKREFYGIDKECDKKFNLIDDFKDLKNIQDFDKLIQTMEGIIIAVVVIPFFLCLEIAFYCSKLGMISQKVYFWMYLLYIIIICCFLSCHTIAYIKMRESDYSNYNCSDSIINEIIKKGNENNKKVMAYNLISFYIDAIIIAGNFLGFIIGLILDLIDKNTKKCKFYKYQAVSSKNSGERDE